MAWVAVKYNWTIGTAVGGAGTGSVILPQDQGVYGQYKYNDKFVDTFNQDFISRGYDFDTAIDAAKHSLLGYSELVQLIGIHSDGQGDTVFYGWSNASVGAVEFGSTIHGAAGPQYPQPTGGPALSYTISFPNESFTYSQHGTFNWISQDLGAQIYSDAPNNFDYNTADYREYLSNQPLYDAKGGNDIIHLPDSAEAARVWEYTNVAGDVDPGGYYTLYVNGGSGNDTVYGGKFIDWIHGDDGNDTLYGGGSADHLWGDIGNDILDGGSGNDYISGDAGDDTIIGGLGADLMIGGDGDDTIGVDNVNDQAYGGDGFDTVYSSVSFNVQGDVEALILTGAADLNVTANGSNNILIGNAGHNVLTGGGGDDIYGVDGNGDTVVEAPGGGYDEIYSSGNYTLPENTETLFLTGSAQYGTGNSGNNGLIGNDADNILDAGAGSFEVINGNGGNDLLIGGPGHDEIRGGAGNDLFRFTSPADAFNGSSNDGDLLLDFTPGQDKIQLNAAAFGIYGAVDGVSLINGPYPTTAAPTLLYTQGNGLLFYDADGVGAQNPTVLAALSGTPALQASDFTVY